MLETLKHRGDTRLVFLTELGKLFATLRPNMSLAVETWNGYETAMGDLNSFQITAIVNEALRMTWQFLPTPGELLEIGLRLREHDGDEPPPQCEICKGTGFRMVN